MKTELDPLSPQVLSALDLERRRPAVPDEQLARLASRLELSFGSPPMPPDAPAAPAAPAATAAPTATAAAAKGLTAGLGGKVLLLAAGLGIGGVSGAQLQAHFGAPRERVVERIVEVPVQVHLPAPAPLAVPDEPVRQAQPPLTLERPRPAKVKRAPVELERLLIEQATAALTRENAAQALDACAQHTARFRDGQLSEERESLAIRALLRLGRRDEALARAAQFRERYPDGLLLDVVEKAMKEAAP